jgi:uncharacterized protein with HEPN domain
MDNISLVETQIDGKIQIIMRQTDYTEEKAREKFGQFKFDELAVIRDYFGITEKKTPEKVTSVNQAIYKQLRGHLDRAMRDYRERVDKGEV